MSDDEFQDDQIDFGEDDGGGFEDFEGGGGASLGDMWRNNPLVKIGVIAGGLITVIGAIILFGGAEEKALPSRVGGGDTVSAAPGGPVSEAMKRAVEEENVQRTEQAVRTGESAIPTPVEAPVERLDIPQEEVAAEDPLERWRRIQEERQRQITQQKGAVDVGDPYADAVDSLSNFMAGQMEGILESQTASEPVHLSITTEEYIEQKRKEERDAAQEEAERIQEAAAAAADVVNILVPSGTIAYAQLITEASSDVEGPILAQLVSGPLAGSRLLGSFETEKEYLILNFEAIVIDGIVHKTEAVAINPDTTSIGMATEVDHRYFTRIVLPAAAAFVEGVGEAIGSTNETTVVVDGGAAVQDQEELSTQEEFAKGFEKAAEKVVEILDENSENTEPLIRVDAGTPMGILFIEPVTEGTQ